MNSQHAAFQFKISIHALREEGDAFATSPAAMGLLFLSTPSARRATWISTTQSLRIWAFLSTPSARRATEQQHCRASNRMISIHALREEGDLR